ncbi:fatty acid desaturase family protein [Caulobacter henricii]|uniref:Fatty acid desaturase n=1 Tax=Caulobacter henricii TaxID=69395 RepID=A0A0P0P2T1_9CAUL|nr:fatty acid desaturase family protein [Caulobacter henricii]ALL14744.1 fatty acid desaturase [Caulobacter henricii]
MAVASRVKPQDLFTPEEWAKISARSSWRGIWMVAHAWGTILLAGALFVAFPNPLTYVLAVMIIGARQLGLAILMHEAAHGGLHPNLKVNDWIGEWLCAAPTGASLKSYRPYHLTHHKYAQQAEDPDLILSAPFPTTRQSLRRKIIRDLTGQTFFKQRFGPLLGKLKGDQPKGAIFSGEIARQKPFLLWNLALLVALSAVGLWWAWLALWIVPMATWFPLVTRLRNIAEHALVARDEPDPFRHARTTKANGIERALIAPYQVNFHAEHHMFMHTPCWNLPLAHRLLERKGLTGGMLTAPGYLSVLKEASSKAEAAA